MPITEDVRAWLHLGASIAARKWSEQRDVLEPLEQVHDFNPLFYAPDLASTVDTAFSSVPGLEILPATELQRDHSELGGILEAGYPGLGFVGPHRFFHTPKDTPKVTSPTLLEPYGDALRTFARELEHPE